MELLNHNMNMLVNAQHHTNMLIDKLIVNQLGLKTQYQHVNYPIPEHESSSVFLSNKSPSSSIENKLPVKDNKSPVEDGDKSPDEKLIGSTEGDKLPDEKYSDETKCVQ